MASIIDLGGEMSVYPGYKGLGAGVLVVLLAAAAVTVSLVDKPPQVTSKYGIWIGDSVVAIRYRTDSYSNNGGMIAFVNKKTGVEMVVPVCNVNQIEKYAYDEDGDLRG
jgi:hypothetical protein